MSENKGKLGRFFEKLSTLGRPEKNLPDHVTLELPDGRTLDVATAPVQSSGANFRTRKVVVRGPEALEVKMTWGAKVFFLLFVGFGLVALLFMLPEVLKDAMRGEEPMTWLGVALVGLLGTVFVLLGAAGYFGYLGSPMAVLDRQVGLWWKGRPPKKTRAWVQPPVSLENIAAVQICSKWISGQKSSYMTYEINLVTIDPAGERINLMSHGKQSAVRTDAAQLAEFLAAPLLDHA
jgi:hypothetical protein